MNQAAAQSRAADLWEGARTHKRLSRRHQRKAKLLMEDLDRLEQQCSEMGIKLIRPKEAETETLWPENQQLLNPHH